MIIGVEPCKNLAQITKRKGYKTFAEYWNVNLAKKITKNGKVDLIYSANTLSHIKNFSEIFKAVNISLNKNGILILEDPSLLECLKKLPMINFIVNTFMYFHQLHYKRY